MLELPGTAPASALWTQLVCGWCTKSKIVVVAKQAVQTGHKQGNNGIGQNTAHTYRLEGLQMAERCHHWWWCADHHHHDQPIRRFFSFASPEAQTDDCVMRHVTGWKC